MATKKKAAKKPQKETLTFTTGKTRGDAKKRPLSFCELVSAA